MIRGRTEIYHSSRCERRLLLQRRRGEEGWSFAEFSPKVWTPRCCSDCSSFFFFFPVAIRVGFLSCCCCCCCRCKFFLLRFCCCIDRTDFRFWCTVVSLSAVQHCAERKSVWWQRCRSGNSRIDETNSCCFKKVEVLLLNSNWRILSAICVSCVLLLLWK